MLTAIGAFLAFLSIVLEINNPKIIEFSKFDNSKKANKPYHDGLNRFYRWELVPLLIASFIGFVVVFIEAIRIVIKAICKCMTVGVIDSCLKYYNPTYILFIICVVYYALICIKLFRSIKDISCTKKKYKEGNQISGTGTGTGTGKKI